MEATGCRLAMTDHRTLHIVSVYLPSPKKLLRRDLRALLALGDAIILFGDFNCRNIKWGCPSNNYNGDKLDRLQDRLDYEIITPSTATYFSHTVTNRPSTLDIALTKGVVLNLNLIETLHGLLSDHRPPHQDSDRELRAGDSGIFRSSEVSARHSRIDKSKKRCSALRERLPTPKYRSRTRALQREVKAHVREFGNESWSDLMEEIVPTHKAFWKITKAFKTEGYTSIPSLKTTDNSVALDDVEIEECLADYIKSECSHASLLHDIAHVNRIEEEILHKASLEPQDDLTPVSLSEVQTLVKSLKTRKAPGLDGISNKAIKCFSLLLLGLLLAIFKACLRNCYFPPAWKEAQVIGIHKPGKPGDLPASYRPITLLSDLGKLFERILKTRLINHLLGKALIIDEQFGFHPAHSCPQQVLRLVEYVSEGFKSKQKTVTVLFDVAKDFDRVWHAGFTYKLHASASTVKDIYE
ncbi:Probable RNA-directed DNA polymerase from transposon BS [Eumeta japonica]|uniref:Probable RNA-directed DNA polymerase from transposon BS n=1 Tax=Eumeta variegata TaxID=151549 RepID=A0A4C1VR66_EUMVA|nr:Probable RNA-directed DNA polymerase from transposon BS [Eumeta japonica]